MGNLIAASTVSVTCLKCVQLGPEKRSHRVQKELSLFVRVETGSLSAFTRLLAGNIVAVLVVNVNSVKILVFDDVNKVVGKAILATKAVIPTVIVISRLRATHSSTTKTHDYFLAHFTPLINQIRTCLVATKRKTARHFALIITTVLCCRPSV